MTPKPKAIRVIRLSPEGPVVATTPGGGSADRQKTPILTKEGRRKRQDEAAVNNRLAIQALEEEISKLVPPVAPEEQTTAS